MATTISNLRTVENNYDVTLENASMDEVLRKALAGNRAALAYCTGRPQLILAFTATVATASDVLISDLTSNFGVTAPAARGVRAVLADLYVGDLTEGAYSRSVDGVKNIGGTVSKLASSSTRSDAVDGGTSASQVQIVVSTTNLQLHTEGTWADDVYECVCEVYLPRPNGGVMSTV
jgi:hypothetical protein